MKRPIVLLSLLSLMMMFTAQLSVMGMEGSDKKAADTSITFKQGNELEDLLKWMDSYLLKVKKNLLQKISIIFSIIINTIQINQF